MSTNTKIYIGLAVLVVIVFGATVIRMGVPDDVKKSEAAGGESKTDGPVGELLRADVEYIYYDPLSDKAVYREYPEYYERNDHPVPLWFSNPNPVPMKLKFIHTSCGACSFADVAAVPTPKIDPTAPPDPFGAVVGGVMGRTPTSPDHPAVPFGLDAAAHAERVRVVAAVPADRWQRIVAENSLSPGVGNPGQEIEFPAGSPDRPAWGVLRLNIKVNESKTLEATIGQQKPGMTLPVPVTYRAKVTLAPLCEVYPGTVAAGELAEGAAPVRETVLYYSSTRPTDGDPERQLPKPVVGGLKGDPFLTVGPPVPLTAVERLDLARNLTALRKAPVRVAGGYRMVMALSRTAPDPDAPGKVREIDLGPAERKVNFAPESGTVEKTPVVVVQSIATGSVAAEGAKVRGGVIELGSYKTREGTSTTVKVSTERPGVELEAVPELNEPSYLSVPPLDAPETKNGRTTWTVKVGIPPGQGGGRFAAGSVVVLRIKGTGQLVRLPVSGNGQN